MLQQPAFAIHTACITGKQARTADDAMTGNDDRDRIPADGDPEGSDGIRCADLLGELTIGECFAFGDVFERLPDFLLKLGTDDEVELRHGSPALATEVTGEPSARSIKSCAVISQPSAGVSGPVLLCRKVKTTETSICGCKRYDAER